MKTTQDIFKIFFQVMVTVLALLLGSCGDLDATVDVVPNTMDTLMPRPATATETASAMPSAKPSFTPGNTATPSSTLLPTSTITLTPEPTWTPLATLASEEADLLVRELLENNGDCQLPCWWGLMPGLTTWNEGRQFLETFMSISNGASRGIRHQNYSALYIGEDLSISINIDITDGVINMIFTRSENTVFTQQVNQLLKDHGPPEDMWLGIIPATPEGPWFYLLLSYPQQGIVSRYNGPATAYGEVSDDGTVHITRFHICPVEISPELWLFPPVEGFAIESQPGLGGDYYRLFKPLQDVTELDVESFHKAFKDADNATCFETLAENWP